MKITQHKAEHTGIGCRIFYFVAGVSALAVVIFLLATTPMPPGVAGAVLRHNLQQNIDATPLIYSEHDGMLTLEENLRQAKRSYAQEK